MILASPVWSDKCFKLLVQVRLVEGRLEDADTLLGHGQKHPVDLDLDWVLGKMPRKVCVDELFLL